MDVRLAAALGSAGLGALASLGVVIWTLRSDPDLAGRAATNSPLLIAGQEELPLAASEARSDAPRQAPAQPSSRGGPSPSLEPDGARASRAPVLLEAAPERKAFPEQGRARLADTRPQRPPPEPVAKTSPEPSTEARDAPAPKLSPKPLPRAEPLVDGVLTLAEIARIKSALRLTREQEAHWPPVESVLTEIGRQQMAQIRSGQQPGTAVGGSSAQRLYSAAGPLLMSLREDQKAEIRRRARSMGLGSIASLI